MHLSKSKTVHVLGSQFDALPGHITVAGRGSGAKLRIAVQRAVGNMLCDSRLKHKQLGSFKLSVVVIAERKHAPETVATLPKGGAA